MAKKKDGGLFFPGTRYENRGTNIPVEVNYSGVTKRQWYAGMALQGLLAHNQNLGELTAADLSHMYADAMIAFEDKENGEV